MADRKRYPLEVPIPTWERFLKAKEARCSHLSVNDTIINALIEYSEAVETEDARVTAQTIAGLQSKEAASA